MSEQVGASLREMDCYKLSRIGALPCSESNLNGPQLRTQSTTTLICFVHACMHARAY